MVITFTADDIFEIAEEIEKNAVEFYSEAAERSTDEDTKKLLLEMATNEDEHLKTFRQMRKELRVEEEIATFDPDRRSAAYLQTMADARTWEGRINPTQELSGNETTRQILDIALDAEKEMVVFYFGLKNLVSTQTGREKVEEIIIEELEHISALLKKLKSLG
ncbi:MAG: ferritin family protein [Planctomycetota bacterium]|jgi:rubrerythrin